MKVFDIYTIVIKMIPQIGCIFYILQIASSIENVNPWSVVLWPSGKAFDLKMERSLVRSLPVSPLAIKIANHCQFHKAFFLLGVLTKK